MSVKFFSLTCLLMRIKSRQPTSCQAKQEHNIEDEISKEELATKAVPLVLQETCHQGVNKKVGIV